MRIGQIIESWAHAHAVWLSKGNQEKAIHYFWKLQLLLWKGVETFNLFFVLFHPTVDCPTFKPSLVFCWSLSESVKASSASPALKSSLYSTSLLFQKPSSTNCWTVSSPYVVFVLGDRSTSLLYSKISIEKLVLRHQNLGSSSSWGLMLKSLKWSY